MVATKKPGSPDGRSQRSGRSDGHDLEAKKHIEGLCLLKCTGMDEAVEWARKATVACRVPVKVREFLAIPEKWKACPKEEKGKA